MSYLQPGIERRVFLVERAYFPDDFVGLVERATKTTEDCRREGRVRKEGRLRFFPSSNYTELVESLTKHHLQHVIAERCDFSVTQETNLANVFPEIINYEKGVYRFTKFGMFVFIPLHCDGQIKIRPLEPEGCETQNSLESTGILIVSGAFDLVVTEECTLIAFGYGKSVVLPQKPQNQP